MNWTQLIVVVLTAAVGFATWYLNEWGKRREADYVRREQRYVELVKALRGFHEGSENVEAKEQFLIQLELCWLYGSDEVVRAAYSFLNKVNTQQTSTPIERATAAGDLMVAIRNDLLRRAPLKCSTLKPAEFQILDVPRAHQ
jgi:hypothetical protein